MIMAEGVNHLGANNDDRLIVEGQTMVDHQKMELVECQKGLIVE